MQEQIKSNPKENLPEMQNTANRLKEIRGTAYLKSTQRRTIYEHILATAASFARLLQNIYCASEKSKT